MVTENIVEGNTYRERVSKRSEQFQKQKIKRVPSLSSFAKESKGYNLQVVHILSWKKKKKWSLARTWKHQGLQTKRYATGGLPVTELFEATGITRRSFWKLMLVKKKMVSFFEIAVATGK